MGTVDGLKKRELRKHHSVSHKRPPEGFDFESQNNHSKKGINYARGLYFVFLFFLVSLGTIFGIESTFNYKTQLVKSSDDVEKEIRTGLDFYNQNNLSKASEHFTVADKKLSKLKVQLQEGGQYIPYFFYLPQSDSSLNESTKILKATSSITEAISLAGNLFSKFNHESNETDQVKLISEMTLGLTNTAKADLTKIQKSKDNLRESEDMLIATRSNNYKSLRQELLKKIPTAVSTVSEICEIYEKLPIFLADGGEKKYLILFQNNSELRPAGGFLGSYAEATFSSGELKTLDFQTNIYKIDKPFMASNPIPAPTEYQYLSTNMALRDSNYNADFEDAMKTVSYFYLKETNQTANGVIAIDTTLITELLKIIGPIDMPEYGLSVTGDNFLSEIEYQVEIGYFKDKANWGENAPKKILAEMMPKIISKTFAGLNDDSKRQRILGLLSESLSSKHLLFYSGDKEVEDYFKEKNYAGKIKESSGDYFFLSSANIGGLKSSLNVKETVSQTASIDANGLTSKSVTIKRQHQGNGSWPDGENKTFNKVFVPLGSKLKSYRIVSGSNIPYSDWANRDKATTETSEENGKTIFSFWLNTKPGESSEFVLEYFLPPELAFTDTYNLLMQKQPGTLGSEYVVSINADRKLIFNGDKQLTAPLKLNLTEDSSVTLKLK